MLLGVLVAVGMKRVVGLSGEGRFKALNFLAQVGGHGISFVGHKGDRASRRV
jgi:hypothetical protein